MPGSPSSLRMGGDRRAVPQSAPRQCERTLQPLDAEDLLPLHSPLDRSAGEPELALADFNYRFQHAVPPVPRESYSLVDVSPEASAPPACPAGSTTAGRTRR